MKIEVAFKLLYNDLKIKIYFCTDENKPKHNVIWCLEINLKNYKLRYTKGSHTFYRVNMLWIKEEQIKLHEK